MGGGSSQRAEPLLGGEQISDPTTDLNPAEKGSALARLQSGLRKVPKLIVTQKGRSPPGQAAESAPGHQHLGKSAAALRWVLLSLDFGKKQHIPIGAKEEIPACLLSSFLFISKHPDPTNPNPAFPSSSATKGSIPARANLPFPQPTRAHGDGLSEKHLTWVSRQAGAGIIPLLGGNQGTASCCLPASAAQPTERKSEGSAERAAGGRVN